MSTEPILPEDLERAIFEMAATHHPGMILALLRVAKRVYAWTEPILEQYRVVLVTPEANGRVVNVAGAALSNWEDAQFAQYVRHMWLDGNADLLSSPQALLRLTTNLTDLSVMGGVCVPALLPILCTMRLRRFTGCLWHLFGGIELIDLAHPALGSLTYLHILDALAENERIYNNLNSLPKLTHLAVFESVPGPIITQIFRICPRLEVFVVLYDADMDITLGEASQIDGVEDARLVLTAYPTDSAAWVRGACGRGDFWSAAEAFVARMRRRQIARPSPWMDN
ncbi:hypothetical protein MVEN_02330300 [Mycena venus]|uniref:Uncharacterized protein n=1 Tax=Mycena venus TaxID=2733690 RepID=A0A8H6X3F6_9AGAR|nr:hypothetical protein MVEN_02330300 [Mycena venus]